MKRKDTTHSLVGPCPIHKGTNQNQFHVSLAKNNFNCFGDCRGGGNILDFVAKMENTDIRSVAVKIQEWFNIEPNSPQEDNAKDTKQAELVKEKKEPSQEERKNQPLKFVLNKLDPNHAYLKEQGLNQETIDYFGVGFCAKGLMKNRIAIPIHNETGELVAYIGRWINEEPPEGEGKYKIPPNFHKSLVVFNLHRAREPAKEKGLILVEGFLGCMKIWQAGFRNVAALMGSSLSEEQEKLIVDVVGSQGKVVLMFDRDKAGQECKDDVLTRLVPQVFVKVVNLPEGKQPDNLNNEEIKELLS